MAAVANLIGDANATQIPEKNLVPDELKNCSWNVAEFDTTKLKAEILSLSKKQIDSISSEQSIDLNDLPASLREFLETVHWAN